MLPSFEPKAEDPKYALATPGKDFPYFYEAGSEPTDPMADPFEKRVTVSNDKVSWNTAVTKFAATEKKAKDAGGRTLETYRAGQKAASEKYKKDLNKYQQWADPDTDLQKSHQKFCKKADKCFSYNLMNEAFEDLTSISNPLVYKIRGKTNPKLTDAWEPMYTSKPLK